VFAHGQKRRFVVLSGSGYRRERKGSPLGNSWRQYADHFGVPCILVQNGGGEPPRPDVVVVDLSPLRDTSGASHAGVRDACVQLAAPLRASLTRDDTVVDASAGAPAVEEEAAAAFLQDGAIWKLRPVALEFTCVDRPSAKALAEALSGALCGVAPAAATGASSKRRTEVRADEDGADASTVQ
jgi:hypothetical protein